MCRLIVACIVLVFFLDLIVPLLDGRAPYLPPHFQKVPPSPKQPVFSKRLISPAFSRSFDPETININWWHYLIFFYEEREAAVTASSSAHWKLLWKLSQNDQ